MPLSKIKNLTDQAAQTAADVTSKITSQVATQVAPHISSRLPIELANNLMSEKSKKTWMMRAFALTKVPMIAFLSPEIIDSNDEKTTLKIPLGYRSKNHLNSMYFGALSVGADMAVGLMAMHHIQELEKETDRKIHLVFKSFKADFLKRAEADVYFSCEQGQEIKDLVVQSLETNDRVELPVKAKAFTPKLFGDDPVATFELVLSLKAK